MREDRGAQEPLNMRRHPGTTPVVLPLPCPVAAICLQHADAMSAQQVVGFHKGFEAASLILGAFSLVVLGAIAFWH